MDIEDKVRKLMRQFEITCPSCGQDHVSVEKEQDTPHGIMDECFCSDCETPFYFNSSILSQYIDKID